MPRGRKPKQASGATRGPAPAKGRYYMISVVAKNYGIHPQTLRLYEREGFLTPSRTEGNTRLYSDEDMKQLELILNLTRDLSVNLAGVEIILNMRRKVEQMQTEVSEFVGWVREELSRVNAEGLRERFESALVKLPSAHIVRAPSPGSPAPAQSIIDVSVPPAHARKEERVTQAGRRPEGGRGPRT